MKVRYQLPVLTRADRLVHTYMLHDEIDKQGWYAIIYLEIWKSEGFICIQ